jgi:hypothetical protein
MFAVTLAMLFICAVAAFADGTEYPNIITASDEPIEIDDSALIGDEAAYLHNLTTTLTNVNTPAQTPTPKPEPTPTPAPQPNPMAMPETVTIPESITGELLIIKKAEQTGDPLYGAVFGVYSAEDDAKIIELTTDADGKVSLALEPGGYYLKELRAPYGYQLEPAKIYFTITANVTVKVEVTNIRDTDIPDGDLPLGSITIPKTGFDFPIGNYALAGFLWGIALLCGFMLYRGWKLKIS